MVIPELKALVALSPPSLTALGAAVRPVCATALRLPPLPAELTAAAADPVVVEFAEQFAMDVTGITGDQRAAFSDLLGNNTFSATALIFIADFVPRVQAGFAALGVHWSTDVGTWDHDTEPAGFVINEFAPAVARLHELDPLTTELVRLRGARTHNCRLCKSLRDVTALDSGGSEGIYDEIDSFESSSLSERHKAALRFVDAMIWEPSDLRGDELLEHFSRDQAVELTLDVMRNACNKIAVALGADAARVESGTEQYQIGADGQPIYS